MSRIRRFLQGSSYALIIAAIMVPMMFGILCVFMLFVAAMGGIALPLLHSGALPLPSDREDTRERVEIRQLEQTLDSLKSEQARIEASVERKKASLSEIPTEFIGTQRQREIADLEDRLGRIGRERSQAEARLRELRNTSPETADESSPFASPEVPPAAEADDSPPEPPRE